MAEPPIRFQSDAYQGLDDDAGGAKHGSTVSRRVGCWRGRARRRRAGGTHAEVILFPDTEKIFSAETNAHLNEPTTTAYYGNALEASVPLRRRSVCRQPVHNVLSPVQRKRRAST